MLPQVDGGVLVTLAAGCRHTEGIRFRYRTHDGTESERSVEPLQIVHTGRRWYLVARDRDRQAWRTFRVDRITQPELTGSRYRFEDPPDPVELVAEGTGVAPWDIVGRVRVQAPAETVKKLIPPSQGVVEAVDATTCEVRFAANDLGPLVSGVMRIYWPFEILDPPELRAAVHEHARRLLNS